MLHSHCQDVTEQLFSYAALPARIWDKAAAASVHLSRGVPAIHPGFANLQEFEKKKLNLLQFLKFLAWYGIAVTPSLLPGPAFAGPKKGTSHLRAQSPSIPAALSLRAAGLEFTAIANTFLAFFLQHGSYHIQGMPDQTTTTFCIKTKASLMFFSYLSLRKQLTPGMCAFKLRFFWLWPPCKQHEH